MKKIDFKSTDTPYEVMCKKHDVEQHRRAEKLWVDVLYSILSSCTAFTSWVAIFTYRDRIQVHASYAIPYAISVIGFFSSLIFVGVYIHQIILIGREIHKNKTGFFADIIKMVKHHLRETTG